MSQNVELAKVKARIKALSLMTISNGCAESEAFTAMKLVGKLLSQYNISMSELDLRDEPCIHEFIQTTSKKLTVAGHTMVGLGKFTDCIVWVQRRDSKVGIQAHFFGLESDVEMAKYLFELIDTMANSELKKFKKTPAYVDSKRKRSTSASFVNGMYSRLYKRFVEMKKEIDAERSEEAKKRRVFDANSKALTIVKENIVKEAFKKKLNYKFRSSGGGSRSTDWSAYDSGHSAADRINLQRPVGGNDSGPRLLK